MKDIILDVKNLKKYFKTPKGMLQAVDDINFSLERGKTLGVVGESGCGKSTTGRAILRLIEPTSGEIYFEGEDIASLNRKNLMKKRKDMQMIFQDPFSSLDPRKSVKNIIAEAIIENKMAKDRVSIEKKILKLMETVGLAERLINAYPHELDGGRRQRVGIARALAVEPKLIVCDEPVSALDVSIQAQILNLLKQLQKEMGLTYIFITHDLSVVNYFADEIAVMYLGQIVEKAPSSVLFDNPMHPYTQALLSAIPVPVVGMKKERIILKGEISSPINLKDECRFAKRCIYADSTCLSKSPTLVEVEPEHFVSCYKPLNCCE